MKNMLLLAIKNVMALPKIKMNHPIEITEINQVCLKYFQNNNPKRAIVALFNQKIKIGTLCQIKKIEIHNDKIILYLMGLYRCKINNVQTKNGINFVDAEILNDEHLPPIEQAKYKETWKLIREIVEILNKYDPVSFNNALMAIDQKDFEKAIYEILSLYKPGEILHIFEETNPLVKAAQVFLLLNQEMKQMTLAFEKEFSNAPNTSANDENSDNLPVKIPVGKSKNNIDKLKEIFEKKKEAMPEEAREKIASKLEKLKEDSEKSLIYCEKALQLPWDSKTVDCDDIKKIKRILEEDHAHLKKVKNRITDFMAPRILSLKNNNPIEKQGTILCFVGPPGVGKTSIGKSIARALGRKFIRIALGGIRDVSIILGHGYTYIGSEPGIIMEKIAGCKSENPVFMIDEIDKLGKGSANSNPESAMLEVLDPEQNDAFTDRHFGFPFDLSNIVFIATANQIETIHPALLDRMEIVNLPGYSEKEKLEIAKKFLIPKQIKQNGLENYNVSFSKKAIAILIAKYTGEKGVRNLERQIENICQKIAALILERKWQHKKITPAAIKKLLGKPQKARGQIGF